MNVQRKIVVGFGVLTILLLFMAGVALNNASQLVSASKDVAHTNELVKALESFLSRLKDTEVAQREYVLTGDETYVEQIVSARADVESQLGTLARLETSRHWLELLKTLVPEKFDEIQRTISYRRSGDFPSASNLMLTNRGFQAMDGIRKVVNTAIQEENRLLQQRSTIQNQKFVTTMVIFATALVLNLVLIWTLFYLVRREAVTARRSTEELEARVIQRTQELQRSNEELQQFAYVASHDMKEPLRMMSSYATLLDRKYRDSFDEQALTFLGFIVDGAARMNALIEDLLGYSRVAQAGDPELAQVSSEEALSGAVTNLSVAIADTQATVTHDALPIVSCDPIRLGQVLQNLIGNALKYRSEKPPVVHVAAERTATETVFSVRDNGMGIPSEHHTQIFGIFKRLHGSEVDGTGIGLATCKRIVEQHGGRIWVESEPGCGSTFRFTVPHRGL